MRWNVLFALLLGAFLGSGSVWLFVVRGPSVEVEGPVGAADCPAYSDDDRALYPGGMVATAADAAAIAERVNFAKNEPPGRRLTVRDGGSFWQVSSRPPSGWKGGGYRVTVSRCDAAVRLVEITQ